MDTRRIVHNVLTNVLGTPHRDPGFSPHKYSSTAAFDIFDHDYLDLENAIHAILNTDHLLTELLSDDRIIHLILDLYKRERHSAEDAKIRELEKKTNGITHEEYDQAVDIVEEFEEMGLDTLDAGQLEQHEEYLAIVLEYERA